MTEVNVIPCRFTAKQVKTCSELGFLTYPEFLDNLYTRESRSKLGIFIKDLEKYGKQIQFVVCPDNKPILSWGLANEYSFMNWIYPLHSWSEVNFAKTFDLVGFPHRKTFRNYSLSRYLSKVPYKKRWYLGFWLEKHPEVLSFFYGMDTTIPETYSGKFGCIWTNWDEFKKPKKKMKNNAILLINLQNLAVALKKIPCHQENFSMTEAMI